MKTWLPQRTREGTSAETPEPAPAALPRSKQAPEGGPLHRSVSCAFTLGHAGVTWSRGSAHRGLRFFPGAWVGEGGCRAAPPTGEATPLPPRTQTATSSASVSPTHPGTAVSHHQWDLLALASSGRLHGSSWAGLGSALRLLRPFSGPRYVAGALSSGWSCSSARTWNQDILLLIKIPFCAP